ncbi:helix-turn-helix transcriptional regulator [Neptuniibacter sp. QD37_11]|uniref:helix-turn-helix transcriptional regulator n=1 Tax=Neptuniibacter sp. QD37_11 TaxID=3398209 RepID=UPI0039F641E7
MDSKRLIRRPEVEQLTGLARSTIYFRIKSGSFPKPIHLGGRLVAWLESDIQKWIDDRISEAEKKQTA